MHRIKFEAVDILISDVFSFSCKIPVRVTDINYGGHVGNDTILSIIHEARMQYLISLGYTEMEFGGTGLIMADVAIKFKQELFYGETILANVTVGKISKISFDLIYKLETDRKSEPTNKSLVAIAKTEMVCFDYKKKKIVSIPEAARLKLK